MTQKGEGDVGEGRRNIWVLDLVKRKNRIQLSRLVRLCGAVNACLINVQMGLTQSCNASAHSSGLRQ